MTRDEAINDLKTLKDFFIEQSDATPLCLDYAIEALEQPIPKPHDRLMYWETARRIIDSPRSKSQMLAVLDSVPPIEALEEIIELKRGEWIPVTNGRGGFECSECHSYAPSYQSGDDNLSNYCPNCGARMDERR